MLAPRLLDTLLNSTSVPETSLSGDEDFEAIKCSCCCFVTAFPKDFSERDSSGHMIDKITHFMATDDSRNGV